MSSTTETPGARVRRPSLATLVVALALLAAAAPVLAEAAPVRLEWTSVEGARSYRVEIRAAGGSGILFAASSAEPWIEAPLEPGDYEIRVSALNVFGRAVATGAWTALTVRATARLEGATLLSAPEADPSTPGLVVVRVAVVGAMPGTGVALEGDGTRIEANSLELDAAGIAASFDLSGAPEGDYDLVLENPGGYIARIAGAVSVAAPKPEPEPPAGTEPAAGTEPEQEPEPEAAEAPETLSEPVAAAVESEPDLGTELGGGTGTVAVAEISPEPESESAEPEPEPGLEADSGSDYGVPAGTPLEPFPERSPRAPVPLRLDLSFGWRLVLPLDAYWGGSYETGLVAAETALGLRLVDPAPAWLRALSLELRVDGFRMPGNTGPFVDSAETLALSVSLELGVSIQPLPWLELVLRGGASHWATHVERTGMIGDFDAWSLGDPAAQGSLAARFRLGSFSIETGCAWQHVFYLDVPADFLRPFLRFGWSFGR
jgi:hypothetical protein